MPLLRSWGKTGIWIWIHYRPIGSGVGVEELVAGKVEPILTGLYLLEP